ncbi:MAG: YjgN family protein [Pseudomonadota bacterium]|uniref:YjgN family protein n=1 Tax=Providencia manganoxydans TaxID=2923283 RepID=UPI0034E5B393
MEKTTNSYLNIEKENLCSETHPVIFHGKKSEYFLIWLVNLLLTIITLGVYSAWATVRTRRYFLGNTEINGSRFEYHASAFRIFLTRLIIVVLLVLFIVSEYIHVGFKYAFLATLFLLTPYFLVRSWRFNAIMTSYRNVRFNFQTNYSKAYWIILLLPFLLIVASIVSVYGIGSVISIINTINQRNNGYSYQELKSFYFVMSIVQIAVMTVLLYLIASFRSKKIYEFFVNHLCFGKSNFSIKLKYSKFLNIYGIAFLIFLPFLIVAALGFYQFLSTEVFHANYNVDKKSTSFVTSVLFLSYIDVYVGFFVSYAYIHVATRRLVINTMEFNNTLNFKSTMTFSSYLLLLITNALLVIFTLGFGAPLAQIRYANYMAENTKIIGDLSLKNEIAHDDTHATALHDEVLNEFDLGLSI